METREEFIKELKEGIDELATEYLDDVEDKAEKWECFKEHKELIENYMVRLSDSEYDLSECRESFMALEAICKTRLQKIIDILNDNDPEITDDMSPEQMKEIVSTQFRNLRTGITASLVSAGLSRLISRVVAFSESEVEAIKEKISNFDEDDIEKFAAKTETAMSEYDFELGCDKSDAKLLEALMGEQYPEFDAFLGR